MRRLLFVLSFVLSIFSFFGFSYASFGDIKPIGVAVCSWGSSTMVVSPGEKKDLCLYFANPSAKDISIKWSLVEWVVTLDWTKACDARDKTGNAFAALFDLGDTSENIITVPASGSLNKKFPLSIPAFLKWQKNGCFLYTSVEPASQNWMFSIEYYSSKDLSLIVLDKQWAYTNDVTSDFDMSINASWEALVSAEFVNKSDFEQDVAFTGAISNILWFQKEFSDSFTLNLKETKKVLLNLGKVPSYKWLFSLNVEWFYQANFGGVNVDVSEEYKEARAFSDSASLFVYSPIALIVCAVPLLLILLLVFALFRRRKVVYVQAPATRS